MMNVSVIIPAYNEQESIGQVLEAVSKVLEENKFIYEIIVVNDGSTDKTAEITSKKGVKLINHNFNHGYGASIKEGLRQSRYNTILIIDADDTYPAEEIPNILNDMKDYDMVIGARIGYRVNMPILRRFAKWFLVRLANYLSESNIADLNSGLRAIRREVFDKFNKLLPNGFSLTTTITLALITNGYQVKYVPINYNRRTGKSKIKPVRDTLNFFMLIIRTSLLFNPLKIFLPVSMMLCLLGFFLFFYSVFFLPYRLDVTAIILFTSSIQLFAIGMIADLINKRIS